MDIANCVDPGAVNTTSIKTIGKRCNDEAPGTISVVRETIKFILSLQ